MLPASLPFEVDDDRTKQIEAMVREELIRASFEITPSDKVDAAQHTVRQRHTKLYDARTGSPIPVALEAYEADLDRTLRAELQCDGVIHVGVALVLASYVNQVAHWDGADRVVDDRLGDSAVLGAKMGLFFLRERDFVPALSLWLRVTDTRMRDVSFRSAGIEAVADVSLAEGVDPLPDDQKLRDTAAIRTAIQSALGPDGRWLRERAWPRGLPDRAEIAW